MPVLFSGGMLLMLIANFGAKVEDPARFPLTRFEHPDEKRAGNPSAVVLDDCDEDFEKSRPHRDGLRILRVSHEGDHRYVNTTTNK